MYQYMFRLQEKFLKLKTDNAIKNHLRWKQSDLSHEFENWISSLQFVYSDLYFKGNQLSS